MASQINNTTIWNKAVSVTGIKLSIYAEFGLFVPTDEAFNKVDPVLLAALFQPENIKALTALTAYHIIPGNAIPGRIRLVIRVGGGKAEIKTLQGDLMTFTSSAGRFVITDPNGSVANVVMDYPQDTYYVYMIDVVLLPKIWAYIYRYMTCLWAYIYRYTTY